MPSPNQSASPCATCVLRSSGFCGLVLQRSVPAAPAVRQAFSIVNAGHTIHDLNEPSEDVIVLCYGWAANLVRLADGRRQILAIPLAGDQISTRMIFADTLHFSVVALTDVRISRINRADLKARLFGDRASLEGLAQICMAEAAAADDLIVDLGRRTADERIAQLILSMIERIAKRSVIHERRYPFPLRQQDIADMLGLTPEHVSRVVTKFRNAGLFEFSGGFLQVRNVEALRRAGRRR
jgi:CRP-like cAMP-binding protein